MRPRLGARRQPEQPKAPRAGQEAERGKVRDHRRPAETDEWRHHARQRDDTEHARRHQQEQSRQQLIFDASANVVSAANQTLGRLIDDLS